MNKKQLKIMWVGIVIFILIGIRPPWAFVITVESPVKVYWEHRLLYSRPTDKELRLMTRRNKKFDDYRGFGFQVYTEALCVEWGIIAVLTIGLIMTYKDKKQKDEENNKQIDDCKDG